MDRSLLRDCRSVVIKVGSSLLASLEGGIDNGFVQRLVDQIATVRSQNRQVVLVSSGAVAAGTAELGLAERPTSLPEIQAAAAVGQGALMQIYRQGFACHEIRVGQVLLTRNGLHDRQRFLHARNTMRALLEREVLPIVNENDTVAVEELKLRLGDNDGLAVSVAQLVEADCLILLSDVPGLYTRPPEEKSAELIPLVAHHKTSELVSSMARSGEIDARDSSSSGLGSGGMSTKLSAALAAGMAAIPLVVASGTEDDIVLRILAGDDIGTLFAPRKKRASLRQQWIAFGRSPEGSLIVDAGAAKALLKGKKSLLAIGIRDVGGDFAEADTVSIQTPEGQEIARGLVNFSSEETRRIAGRRSNEFAEILGYECCATVVHRDNLVMLREGQNSPQEMIEGRET